MGGYARPMDAENQAADGAHGEHPAGRETVPPPPEPPGPFPVPAPLAGDDPARRARRGLLAWLGVMAVGGLGGLIFHQPEAVALVAIGTLFAAAHAADLDPAWRPAWGILALLPPAGGMILFATLAWTLERGTLGPWARGAGITIAALGAVALALSAWPRAAERLAGRLFPTMAPGFAARLGAQLVIAGVLFGVPAWFAFDSMKDTLLEDPGLLEKTRLSGGLVGYVALAFGGVGLGVRRDLRQSLTRLGLGPVAARHIGIIAAGALALFALNAGGEQIQERFFPALWKADHEVTRLIARALSPGRIVLIGVTAGIGEEITLRGGLQPRLGIALTSLLFAALHVQYSWFGMLLVFTLGVTLGIIRSRANTTAAIVVHGLYDMLALVTS